MAKVTMPQLGETVADGTVTKWFKAVGDVVEKGETLFEVSTDKVDTEIPSPASGTLTEILVQADVTVDVGTILALIDDGLDETPSPPVRVTTVAGGLPPTETTSYSRRENTSADDVQLSPVVRRLVEENGLELANIVGSGPNGRVTRQDVLKVIETLEDVSASETAKPQSPIVRRLMSEHRLDAARVTGSGPNGTITRHDVDLAIGAASSVSAPGDERDQVVPFTKIRRLTAEHMVRSKATSAHTLMVREVDYEVVEQIRARHGAAFRERHGFGLSYLPFNAVATVEALRDFPRLNASVGDDELLVHSDVNLGIAVDLDNEGLIVPVIRDVRRLDVTAIAVTVRDLAERARTKLLGADELAGGTFTISNPGPYGTLLTGAIINQPQVAILSTDAVVRKPVVVIAKDGTESVGIHSVGLLALTFDHRAIDGAYAARFLSRIAEVLATREWEHDFSGVER